jgi:hypothetical protein
MPVLLGWVDVMLNLGGTPLTPAAQLCGAVGTDTYQVRYYLQKLSRSTARPG